jgi:hypothetical protein
VSKVLHRAGAALLRDGLGADLLAAVDVAEPGACGQLRGAADLGEHEVDDQAADAESAAAQGGSAADTALVGDLGRVSSASWLNCTRLSFRCRRAGFGRMRAAGVGVRRGA